ncbi:sigma factor [Terracoccus luteus]|uniref:RNA polymerase sigma-70 factor (ECF subfamily) n=1 Tax=Terracoccus luteus TaxID=53356 RepID=A0A839PZC2_9MICO|nr:sigma factor [Terracoccus luteus]MBB2988054.1 RNA polymerase sigma-70 factor (ECF subfamily) [Terracoccus luteus]MCP2173705.1 RNA polymerase sigma-70 factor (ECF subfamily) [Terracoccus luteus]
MDTTAQFEAERARLQRLAARTLGDAHEADDVVQQAWLRLSGTSAGIENLPAWLTTVTTRLCLDRLRARVPEPAGPDRVAELAETVRSAPGHTGTPDPLDEVALADSVGVALQVVLDRLTPPERVAFVMHDSFGFEFPVIAAALDTSPAAARQLASRARAKVRQPASDDALAQWEVVDAFMAAARGGDFERLLTLLAPDADVVADAEAVQVGTPGAIVGRRRIAEFFDGSAHAALPVFVGDRAGYAWFDRGRARVLFDFDVEDGQVRRITFRAEPGTLARVVRREADRRR